MSNLRQPPRPTQPRRQHHLHVAVSAEELAALDAEALRDGSSRSDVVRRRIRAIASPTPPNHTPKT